MDCELLDPAAPTWAESVDALWAALGAPDPALFPAYFVKTSFARLGGRVARLTRGAGLVAVGLLFPRALDGGRPVYTLRLHALPGARVSDDEALAAVGAAVAPAGLALYRPEAPRSYAPSAEPLGEFELGAPAPEETEAIRGLQRAVWEVEPASLFPADMHAVEFGLGTSLVARHRGRVVAFLFGFVTFGLPEALGRPRLGIESQLMAIEPAYRRYGLAAALKRAQARQAIERGMAVIHWTVDPLQAPNAGLNFGRLRAVAGAFYPNYYPYRNALNRVYPSRLGVTWLLDTPRGRAGLAGDGPRGTPALAAFPGVVVVEPGQVGPPGAPFLALPIPPDWAALQRDDLAAAAAWRQASDVTLAAHIGYGPGRYLAADSAAEDGRCYLVLAPAAAELLAGDGRA